MSADRTRAYCARNMEPEALTTQLGDLTITRASIDQSRLVLALRDNLAQWMVERGIQQWRPGELPTTSVEEWIQSGNLYVVWAESTIVGSVTVIWDDALTWGQQPEPAGYIHQLMVTRAAAGHNVGHALLAWAEQMIARSGRNLARLDCVRGNRTLRDYYEHASYRLVGYKDFPNIEWALETALYEKPLLISPT